MKINIVLLLLLLSFGINAQVKIGYINTQELIQFLPEVKVANDSVESLKTRLSKKVETLVTELRTKAINLEQRKSQIAPIQYEKEVQLLQAEEKKIGEMEALSQEELQVKAEGYLAPIRNKINAIIKEVATEEGYSYVVDTSQGWVLYADETVNLKDKVLAKVNKK